MFTLELKHYATGYYGTDYTRKTVLILTFKDRDTAIKHAKHYTLLEEGSNTKVFDVMNNKLAEFEY